MKQIENQVEYRPLKDLHELENNPRQIKKDQFEKLKQSIKDNPDYFEARPIILSDRTGELVILAGNQRYKAAKAIGMTEVPTILLPNLTEEREKEIIIRDNVENGDWDWDMLANEWDADVLDSWGVDLPISLKPKIEIEEDEAPEPERETTTKLGDIFILGGHKVMCGDSTSLDDMQKLTGGGCLVDMWLTDPPYNVAYGQYGSATEARALHRRTDAKTIMNDHMEDEQFREFLTDAYATADAVMKPGAAFYIFHADNESYNFRGAARDMGWQVRECLIWNKNTLCLGRQDYQWKHEPCLYGWKDGAHNWFADRKQTTVIDFDRPTKSGEHPTMKPIGLMAYLIQNSTKEGDFVLDSFGGSGSTLIACEQTGRKCMTMELDPCYVDVIVKRWENLTGNKAIKEVV